MHSRLRIQRSESAMVSPHLHFRLFFANLTFSTASDFPYCQVLTMAHIFPNTTYTAFQCAQTSSNTIALYNGWSNTPVGAGAASSTSTSTTSTSTYSATTHVPTSVTQSSLPASAAATITNMPSPTSGADQLSLPYSAWIILTLLLTL